MQLKKVATTRLSQLQEQLRSLVAEAASHNIVIDPTEGYSLPTAAHAYDDSMKYVKALAELNFLHNCTSNGGGYVAALTTNASRTIAARAQSHETRAKLEAQICRLEQRLGVEHRWNSGCPEYQVSAHLPA